MHTAGAAMTTGHLFFWLVWAIVVIVPFWKINQKAGYSGYWALLLIVPLINLVYLYYLAFSTWPSQPVD